MNGQHWIWGSDINVGRSFLLHKLYKWQMIFFTFIEEVFAQHETFSHRFYICLFCSHKHGRLDDMKNIKVVFPYRIILNKTHYFTFFGILFCELHFIARLCFPASLIIWWFSFHLKHHWYGSGLWLTPGTGEINVNIFVCLCIKHGKLMK